MTKRINLMKSKVTVLLLVISRVYCSECNFNTTEIDWKRLEGTTWYQMLNSNDALDVITQCYVIRFVNGTSFGSQVKAYMIKPDDPQQTIVTTQEFTKQGSMYILDKKREMRDDFGHSSALFTDYESYFLDILCTPDINYVFAYSNNSGKSVEQVLKIHNILADNSVHVRLYPAKCSEITDIDSYLK